MALQTTTPLAMWVSENRPLIVTVTDVSGDAGPLAGLHVSNGVVDSSILFSLSDAIKLHAALGEFIEGHKGE